MRDGEIVLKQVEVKDENAYEQPILLKDKLQL